MISGFILTEGLFIINGSGGGLFIEIAQQYVESEC